jgi:serine/threonine protein kinase
MGTTNVKRSSTLNTLQKLQFWKSSGQHARWVLWKRKHIVVFDSPACPTPPPHSEDFIQEMRVLSKLRSPWTVTMIGAILDYNCDPVLVMEFMDLGSLYSLLHNNTIDVDQESMRMMVRGGCGRRTGFSQNSLHHPSSDSGCCPRLSLPALCRPGRRPRRPKVHGGRGE